MLPESAFTQEVKNKLPQLNLSLEMAVASEWIVRDNDLPDHLELVFVAATEQPDELEAACSCIYGVKSQPCAHAVAVFDKVREHPHILRELQSAAPPKLVA